MGRVIAAHNALTSHGVNGSVGQNKVTPARNQMGLGEKALGYQFFHKKKKPRDVLRGHLGIQSRANCAVRCLSLTRLLMRPHISRG